MSGHRRGPETERLALRAFEADDAEAFFALNNDPEVMKFTGEPPCVSVAEARAAILAYPDFDDVGYGRWGCVLKETREVIGFCGLKFLPDFGEADIGFRFRPAYWGQGLATEAGLATIDYGFAQLGLDRIIALVLPENAASIRVLEKLGMTRTGRVDYDGLRPWRYQITKEYAATVGRYFRQ